MEQAAPLCTPPPAEGRGRESSSSAPRAFGVELWKRLQQPRCAVRCGGCSARESRSSRRAAQSLQPAALRGRAPQELPWPGLACSPRPPQPTPRRQTGACRENFERAAEVEPASASRQSRTSGGTGLARGESCEIPAAPDPQTFQLHLAAIRALPYFSRLGSRWWPLCWRAR